MGTSSASPSHTRIGAGTLDGVSLLSQRLSQRAWLTIMGTRVAGPHGQLWGSR